ncbi:DUF4301 family protein [Mycoplasmatota bacterium]|nr:DUF4301 family protein [Mycoplasmatota bacterium]
MNEYIRKFKQGTQFVNIVSPVTQNELTDSLELSDEYLKKDTLKFVPASGAATRMFKDLYVYLNEQKETDFIKKFFDELEKFPFYHEIKKADFDRNRLGDRIEIINCILKDKLNYGQLPKALIKMHSYDDFYANPIDEHIYEGEQYLNPDHIGIHFTISKEHEDLFNDYVKKASQDKDHLDITYSFQKEETNTLAVDMDNEPVLTEDNQPLFRPGGHGALLENLNDLDADIVFIKNIDNVCHRSKVKDTIDSKKKLASIGLKIKKQIDAHIKGILNDQYDLDEVNDFLKNTLNIVYMNELTRDRALSFLNRPLRVCGMVKNQGEPGGGPFLVNNGDYTDLQIIEKSEIDLNQEEYKEIFNQSQYFNPVDLVCFIKDYKNEKFNLLDYVNNNRYFITEKSYKGKKIKAIEHPGLWNGAMHDWNSVFVEVPLTTFNPVKTVNDLLREGHLGKK